ncbi:hypothetical protein [Noviherbaspirillum pedocola]|uniref:Uncharacterized protein n=1 Tax=Noviherbaspirillum pedocola TaxID=2801341 RepID=A0A934SZU6_9BURK|nr:hypothetical protein [Noviherbaspirillum pedocola]MBK4736082.1 hypothetical protein [Noviherbaspirillum pedocola]
MTAALIPAGTDVLLFGAQWSRVLQGQTEFAKTLELGRKVRARFKARYARSGVVAVGVAPRPASNAKDRRSSVPCAAILFARHLGQEEHGIYLWPGAAGGYRLIAIVDGLPYLECEVQSQQVEARIASLQAETQAHFALHGHCAELGGVTPLDLENLVEGGTSGAMATTFTDTRSLKTIATIATLVLAGIGLNEANKVRLRHIAEDEARILAIDPINAYTENLNGILRTAGFDGKAAFEDWWMPVAPREIVVAGWREKSMLFRVDTAVDTWERLPGTTEGAMREALDGQTHVVTDGKILTSKRHLDTVRSALRRTALPENSAYMGRLHSWQEDLAGEHIEMTFQIPQLVGLPPDLMASQIPPRITVARGVLTMKAPLGLLQDTLYHLDPNIAVDELLVEVSGAVEEARFSLKGTYYVKN